MIPVARTAKIFITEVDNEVMIYDHERDACHCLNPIATKVYYYADGRNTVDDIAEQGNCPVTCTPQSSGNYYCPI